MTDNKQKLTQEKIKEKVYLKKLLEGLPLSKQIRISDNRKTFERVRTKPQGKSGTLRSFGRSR